MGQLNGKQFCLKAPTDINQLNLYLRELGAGNCKFIREGKHNATDNSKNS